MLNAVIVLNYGINKSLDCISIFSNPFPIVLKNLRIIMPELDKPPTNMKYNDQLLVPALNVFNL